jgi:hypothetical protein
MSSEVQAKWMNSLTRVTWTLPASLSLRKYSTALTSWLVVFSWSFTAWASAREKSAATASSAARVAAEKAGTSAMAGSAARALSHSISTLTRYLISPNSLK